MALPGPTPFSLEETPLLHENQGSTTRQLAHELVYQRFSARKKQAIVAMVSMCGLMPFFISGTFIPCIPQIARDLETTGSAVSLAVSAAVLAISMGALTGSTYSSFYGRRPVYIWILPLSVVGSIGIASSTSVPQLIAWRFLQTFGVSPGMALGAGVIGDIYKLEERGTAMGIFFAAVLLGPALAPFAGGLAAHYASWRWMQAALGVLVGLAFVLMVVFFPETTHPGTRGIEKLQRQAAEAEPPITYEHPRWRPVFLNPFQSLALLRSPTQFAVAFVLFLAAAVEFTLLVPLAYTIGRKYSLPNEAWVGACFIPNGLGSMMGAPLGGRLSDRIVTKWKNKRGVWYPEDRLRAALPGALVLAPLSALATGILTTYVDGPLGLALNLVCLFINGLGIDMIFSSCSAYVVDIMHSKSSESTAAIGAVRTTLLSLLIPAILPMIEKQGVLFTDACAAFAGWASFGVLWLTIRYGESMRAWVDVGFSNEETN